MNILAFADIRTSLELPDVQPDVILLLGDIPSLAVARIDRKYDCIKLGVLGNHCHPSVFSGTSVINMHEKTILIKGISFAGFEGVPPYKDRPHGQRTEAELQSFLNKVKNQHIDIFLMHSNPSYGDKGLDDAHRGYQAITSFLFEKGITYLFHGHLHDPFIRKVEDTTIHSVYPYSWLPNLKLDKE